jgi:predicted transposase/invertase (TIGR01784 family)
VVELELKNPYTLADYQADKISILDIKANAKNGCWSSFLTTAHQLDREHTPKELAYDKNIVKAIAAIDRMFNEEEPQVYEVRLKENTDVASIIASGAEKNIAKGVEIGMEIGMETASKAIAFNLLGKGLDITTIAEVTGLTVLEIASFSKKRSEQ